MTYTAPGDEVYPYSALFPITPGAIQVDPYGRSPDELAVLRGEGLELIPPGWPTGATFPEPNLYPGALAMPPAIAAAVGPSGPTLERLWQLANYDPIFYRGLVAAMGYTKAAWQSIDAPPPPIEPWIAPRPIPAYLSVSSSVGLDESEVNGEFGPNAGSSF